MRSKQRQRQNFCTVHTLGSMPSWKHQVETAQQQRELESHATEKIFRLMRYGTKNRHPQLCRPVQCSCTTTMFACAWQNDGNLWPCIRILYPNSNLTFSLVLDLSYVLCVFLQRCEGSKCKALPSGLPIQRSYGFRGVIE